jgi:hypothetical protein
VALKIVHLCDVHSSKGEDVPAAFAHTLVVDGGTYIIDLCKPCDDERFTPLAAFMDAFGLLTEGTVDPREAVAENLRATVRQESPVAAVKPAPVRAQAPAPQKAPAVPVQAPAAAPVPSEPESRSDLVLRLIRASKGAGVGAAELAEATGVSVSHITTFTSPLRMDGLIDFVGRRWYAPEHVPQVLKDGLAKRREVVQARNAIPRECILDGQAFVTTQQWDDHCQSEHGAKPAEVLGLACPLDRQEFTTPQLLGMHGRQIHNCAHTPQLFNLAVTEGDPVGIIADIKARFSA